jgi:hypothetical protein
MAVCLWPRSGTTRAIQDGTLLDKPFVTIPDVDDEGAEAFRASRSIPTSPPTASSTSTTRKRSQMISHRTTASSGLPQTPPMATPTWQPNRMGSGSLSSSRTTSAARKNTTAGTSTSATMAGSTSPSVTTRGAKIPAAPEHHKADQPLREGAAHQRRRLDPNRQPVLQRDHGQESGHLCQGFRNPFSFADEPASGNRIYINDVGEQTLEEIVEEIDQLKAGANYG